MEFLARDGPGAFKSHLSYRCDVYFLCPVLFNGTHPPEQEIFCRDRKKLKSQYCSILNYVNIMPVTDTELVILETKDLSLPTNQALYGQCKISPNIFGS